MSDERSVKQIPRFQRSNITDEIVDTVNHRNLFGDDARLKLNALDGDLRDARAEVERLRDALEWCESELGMCCHGSLVEYLEHEGLMVETARSTVGCPSLNWVWQETAPATDGEAAG